MNDCAFDTLTRRASLAALSAAGMMSLVSPVAEAKRKNKNKKRKNNVDKKARKKCEQQGEACIAQVEERCGGDASCLAVSLPCCEFAGSCDLTGTLDCLIPRGA